MDVGHESDKLVNIISNCLTVRVEDMGAVLVDGDIEYRRHVHQKLWEYRPQIVSSNEMILISNTPESVISFILHKPGVHSQICDDQAKTKGGRIAPAAVLHLQ